MKRLSNQTSAKNHHKQVCENASRIERDLHELTAKVSDIQKFYRDQYADNFQDQSLIRSAENELIRLNRKISSLQVVLKHLANVRFPELKMENSSNQSSNKIDKNVRNKILQLKPEEDGVE